MTTLLVDDDPGALHALRMGLTSHGFRVLAASSGRAAVEVIRESLTRADPIGLLITDFRMPGMNGVQLIQAARELLPDLPTILITGYGSEGLRENVERMWVSVYLEKPFTPRVLVQLASGLLGREAPQAKRHASS